MHPQWAAMVMMAAAAAEWTSKEKYLVPSTKYGNGRLWQRKALLRRRAVSRIYSFPSGKVASARDEPNDGGNASRCWGATAHG